jgi:hypothetical protein
VALKPGDPIWFCQYYRGGYGWEDQVPGEFVRATPRRVTVRLFTRTGQTVVVHVAPQNVTRRDLREGP